jgi:hypothetical protein
MHVIYSVKVGDGSAVTNASPLPRGVIYGFAEGAILKMAQIRY